MRKWNAVLTACILALFLVHAILGGLQLFGGSTYAVIKPLARVNVGLIALHAALGAKLTADTLRVRKKTGVSYPRENALFWARRISGLAVLVLLGFHMTAFGYERDGVYRLRPFGSLRLAAQLLLAAALAVHVIANVKPLLIAFGLPRLRRYAGDILAVLSVLLLVFAAAFVVYYLRWNVW